MIFEITRISTRGKQPHPDAVEKTGWVAIRRNLKDKIVPKQYAEVFWRSGRNHLVEEGIWYKEGEHSYWEIDLDITTIDELFDFKRGLKTPIILQGSRILSIDKKIEIYDDYRE